MFWEKHNNISILYSRYYIHIILSKIFHYFLKVMDRKIYNIHKYF